MRKHTRTPYSNQKKWIPKDRRVPMGYIHPADHFNVNQQDIAVGESGAGGAATSDIAEPNNPPSGVGGDGSAPGSITNLVRSITSVIVTPETISGTEPTGSPVVLSVVVEDNRLDRSLLTFQWQRQDYNTTTWNDISGERTETFTVSSGLTVANDNGDKYRCVVSHPNAVNSPSESNEVAVTVTRVIEITDPVQLGLVVPQGSTKTFDAIATISSGTMNYQWQVKLAGTTTFSDIVAATGTVSSGNSVTYTTAPQTTANNGDEYRVIFRDSSAIGTAPDVIGASITMAVSGADFRVSPSINGVEYWSFEEHGSLVFDPNVATNYSITSLENDRSKISTHLWGQGRCGAKGGYTDADLLVSGADQLAIRMNAGGGDPGLNDSGRYAEAGGGYAGIFDTSVSHSNALAIAGGAGGASLNTSSSCGGSQQSVSYIYSYSVPYQTTCYNNYYETVTEKRSGGLSHSYDNANRRDRYLNYWGDTGQILTVGPGINGRGRTYFVVFRNYMDRSNFNVTCYPSSCTAAGGACPGFYYSINITLPWGFVVQFYRRDSGAHSFVSSFSYTASYQTTRYVQNSYPCTKYTTVQGSFNHVGTAKAIGGSGGGASGGDGSNGVNSLISSKGGYGGTQSSAGTGGSTSSGGSTNGNLGAALQGGQGGNNSGPRAAAGGGGGGGGYYGGGGGAGGYDGYNGSSSNPGRGPQSGGGGGAGSGYIHPTAIGSTGAFAGSSHPDRGSAGDEQQNSRVVIEGSYIEITTQPSSVVLSAGTATFTVVAAVKGMTGQTPTYQWQIRATGSTAFSDISGATSANYTTPTLSLSNNNDRYRCIIKNDYCATKITEEVLSLVTSSGSQTYTITQTGVTTIPLPQSATEFDYAVWGAGGQGVGECPTGNFSGGSGGFARGTVTVPSNNTNSIVVFVGATGQGSPNGQAGYGAGRGGQRSEVYFGSQYAIVGGGGGAGQNGQGGGGGGTGGGGAGTGPNTGQVSGTSGRSGGGAGGGSGVNQGNRGGGGGSGVSGGAGAGGNGSGNCTGGGGGGGSGSITLPVTDSQNGNQGSGGGVTPNGTTVTGYVSGHGGSSQNGLAVISVVVPGSLQITGSNSGNVTDISSLSSATTLSEPVFLTASAIDYNVTVRLRGGTPPGVGGDGGYVQGTFTAKAGQSYNLFYDSRYAALFYGTGTNGNNCIMLAAEGGYEGVPRSELSGGGHPARPSNTPGGNAGYPNGSVGSNLNNSYGGTGGIVNGYKSGQGGNGGQPGSSGGYTGSAGSSGGFFQSGAGGGGIDGDGGDGGFGYYGGGGGGGGWDLNYDAGGYFGGGGGGGASYIGGLPTPAQNANSPAEVTVSNTSYGNETGGTQIQIISVAQA